jgi:hypothetical protein
LWILHIVLFVRPIAQKASGLVGHGQFAWGQLSLDDGEGLLVLCYYINYG